MVMVSHGQSLTLVKGHSVKTCFIQTQFGDLESKFI